MKERAYNAGKTQATFSVHVISDFFLCSMFAHSYYFASILRLQSKLLCLLIFGFSSFTLQFFLCFSPLLPRCQCPAHSHTYSQGNNTFCVLNWPQFPFLQLALQYIWAKGKANKSRDARRRLMKMVAFSLEIGNM